MSRRRQVTLTKNDMARVVSQAVHNATALPPADHWSVIELTKKFRKPRLAELHKQAVQILCARISLKTEVSH